MENKNTNVNRCYDGSECTGNKEICDMACPPKEEASASSSQCKECNPLNCKEYPECNPKGDDDTCPLCGTPAEYTYPFQVAGNPPETVELGHCSKCDKDFEL